MLLKTATKLKNILIKLIIGFVALIACNNTANYQQALEAFASTIEVDLSQQIVAPYQVCYDIGGRCYLMAHYTTPANLESITKAIDQLGLQVIRFSNMSGSMIVNDINLSTTHRLTFRKPDQESTAVEQLPPTIQWVFPGDPEKVLRWYGTSEMKSEVYFDERLITENILTIAVRTR